MGGGIRRFIRRFAGRWCAVGGAFCLTDMVGGFV